MKDAPRRAVWALAGGPRRGIGLDGRSGLVEEVAQVEAELVVLGALRDHPGEGDVRETRVRGTTAHIGVNAGEPDLKQFLLVVFLREMPQQGLEGGALLVERQRVERIVDVAGQARIAGLKLLAKQPAREPEVVEADRVPHADDLDREPRQGVAEAQPAARLVVVAVQSVRVVVVVDGAEVVHAAAGQEAHVRHQAGGRPGCIRTAREAEEVDLVAVVVVVGQKGVCGADVGAETETSGSCCCQQGIDILGYICVRVILPSPEPIAKPRAHSFLIIHDLRHQPFYSVLLDHRVSTEGSANASDVCGRLAVVGCGIFPCA